MGYTPLLGDDVVALEVGRVGEDDVLDRPLD
jgi:hypothetical protein